MSFSTRSQAERSGCVSSSHLSSSTSFSTVLQTPAPCTVGSTWMSWLSASQPQPRPVSVTLTRVLCMCVVCMCVVCVCCVCMCVVYVCVYVCVCVVYVCCVYVCVCLSLCPSKLMQNGVYMLSIVNKHSSKFICPLCCYDHARIQQKCKI